MQSKNHANRRYSNALLVHEQGSVPPVHDRPPIAASIFPKRRAKIEPDRVLCGTSLRHNVLTDV